MIDHNRFDCECCLGYMSLLVYLAGWPKFTSRIWFSENHDSIRDSICVLLATNMFWFVNPNIVPKTKHHLIILLYLRCQRDISIVWTVFVTYWQSSVSDSRIPPRFTTPQVQIRCLAQGSGKSIYLSFCITTWTTRFGVSLFVHSGTFAVQCKK
jgi:hypothetical protein